MATYNYNQNRNQNFHQNFRQSPLQNPVQTSSVRKSILEAYAWMFGGLVLTGAVAWIFNASGALLSMLQSFPMLMYLLPLLQIGLAIGFTFSMAKASANTLRILFLLYAGTMGISMSSLLYVYTDGTIYLAFFISALYFACLWFIGATTKKDLSKLGTIALAALAALLVSQLVMMLFGVNMDVRLYSVLGLLIFSGITAFDVQRLNSTMLYAQGQPVAQQKWAIYFALELYLDFINIFLYILRLLGSNSSNRR